MSVSHPLLKKLKAFVIALRSKDEAVKDTHHLLLPLCDCLEHIFFKGLKATTSWFGQSKAAYWSWISKVPSLPGHERISPILIMAIASVKSNKKSRHDLGRGRNFLRTALMKKVLTTVVQVLIQNPDFTLSWYNESASILGNEILIEIFHSLLMELQAVTFKIQLKNAAFLDMSWELPLYKQYELVPSDELGLDIRCIKGYPVVTQVDPLSVAAEDAKVCVGDVLDEMCGECLRTIGKSGIYFIFNQHENQPIQLNVLKSLDKNGHVYSPIGRLLESSDVTSDLSPATPTSPGDGWADIEERPPPESILPEHIDDEVPVHDSEARAKYNTLYLGKAYLGKNGRVSMIEHGVSEVLSSSQEKQTVILELGEKEVTLTDTNSAKVIQQHLFTEISACGRRTDALKYFAYIAGEAYCSLAEKFNCYVFEAKSEDEAKIILCTIAQGFERTHLLT